MPGYTLVNLQDVEDQAPKFGLTNIEARFPSGPLGLEKSGISYQRLGPNYRTPFGHKHRVQEEIYVLLSGSARAKLDDQIVELKPYDALRVPNDTMRAIEAGPEGAEILAFGAPRTGPLAGDDGEVTMGWWTD